MRKILYYFGQMTDEDIEWLAQHGKRRSLRHGDVLIQEGKHTDAIDIVLDGHLTVTADRRTVTRLAAGELVGELSFVDSRPPSATVTVDGFAHVLAVDKDLLRRRLERETDFAARFYKGLAVFLADRLRTTTARSLGYGEVQSLSEDVVLEDELDQNVLDSVSLAGQRFARLVRAVAEHPVSS
jgi:CRP-like cAMP-binding protein